MVHGAIDEGIASTALLVGRTTAVAYTRHDQAMLDPRRRFLVARKPCDRTDGPRHEEEAVAAARLQFGEALCQVREERDPRAIVICQRGMADVGREEELFFRLSRKQKLPVGKAAF